MAPSSDTGATGAAGRDRASDDVGCSVAHRARSANRSHAALSQREAMNTACITVITAEMLYTFRLKSSDRARRLARAVLMR